MRLLNKQSGRRLMNLKKVLWGLFFVLSAILIVLNQLGLYVQINIFSLILCLLLVPIFVKSIMHLHYAGIFFPIAIVGILFDKQLGIEKLTPFPILGVALFLSIGFSILFSKHPSYVRHQDFLKKDYSGESSSESDSRVNIDSQFTGSVKYITSESLEAVNIRSSFSGLKVFLDNAKINKDEAEINIDASFSGIELYVPKNWRIKNKIDCSMAGVDEKGNKSQADDFKTVILNGYIRLSGITIIYV